MQEFRLKQQTGRIMATPHADATLDSSAYIHSFQGDEVIVHSSPSTTYDDIVGKLGLKSRGKLRRAQPQVISSLGTAVPEIPHAVSVCMPAWQDNVDYEEGDPRVHEKLESGYPRFCFHPCVKKLISLCAERFSTGDEYCLPLPSLAAAVRCRSFVHSTLGRPGVVRLCELGVAGIVVAISSVEFKDLVKSFWQHSGEIVTSRRAETALRALSTAVDDGDEEEGMRHIEEHYGRQLSLSRHTHARDLVVGRIASLSGEAIDHVLLCPTGMAAIFTVHRALLTRHPKRKSVMFGFPYLDTLKILQKFGPGCVFLGLGEEEDLASLERHLETAYATDIEENKIFAVFCEFPSNPLCKSPALGRLSRLSRKYGFPIVVDDTIGGFANVAVTSAADVVVTSLTKLFSGESNVMGGSIVVSSQSPLCVDLLDCIRAANEDVMFPEDLLVLERNSRDYAERAKKINKNAERLCDFLAKSEKVLSVFYPKFTTAENYRAYKKSDGGFGGLFSVVLKDEARAPTFFDALQVSKGPSLGTNFTLCCPYTILAHYTELGFAREYGISPSLIRVSVGLEDGEDLIERFAKALDAV
eukprot:Opistho-2@3953